MATKNATDFVWLMSAVSLCKASHAGVGATTITCASRAPLYHVDNPTYCPSSSEIVMGCQAAENYTLRLVCGQCSADVQWQRWNGKWQNITSKSQTLEYLAKQVVPSLAGCYRCWCHLPGGSVAVATISVDVKLPGELKCVCTCVRACVRARVCVCVHGRMINV